MRYVAERYKEKISEVAYRIFVTDALKEICRSNGKRYYDIYQEIMNIDSSIDKEQQAKDDFEESKVIISNIKTKLKRME
jgi:cell division protein FtsL